MPLQMGAAVPEVNERRPSAEAPRTSKEELMDYGKAFTFMFEDREWLRKLGIGTAVALVGILFAPFIIGLVPLIIVLGYTIEVIRNVMNGEERPLPEWSDWGGFLSRGFKVAAAAFIWALPAILLSIPLAVGSALTNQGQGGEAIGITIVACASCLLLLWALFATLLSPAIYIRIAATDRFSSAFEFGKMWAFTRDNLGNIIIALLLVIIVVGLIASLIAFLGVLLICIGVFITLPFAMLWQYLVQAHLFGQIAKDSVAPID
jgi:hypothetical protein